MQVLSLTVYILIRKEEQQLKIEKSVPNTIWKKLMEFYDYIIHHVEIKE